MDGDTELLLDIGLDGTAQGNDVLTGSSTTIDQHECLLVVNASWPQRAPLPSAMLNEPAGRNLHKPTAGRFILAITPTLSSLKEGSIDRIVWHVGIAFGKLLILLLRYDGIHEEAAGIAQ